jgi:hypothetical protein
LNEYTRREEIRWTLVSVILLVPCVTISFARLWVAEGPLVTNPEAIRVEQEARAREEAFKGCVRAATGLADNVDVFRKRALRAEREAEQEADRLRKMRRVAEAAEVQPVFPWAVASEVLKNADALHKGRCRDTADEASPADKAANEAWNAASRAGRLPDPGNNEKKQQRVAADLWKRLKEAPVEKLVEHVQAAQKKLHADVETRAGKRKDDLVRAELPTGMLPRGAAIGIGIGVALAALIISFVSVRTASVRRARALVSVRRFANTPESGLQAATIVRLAAHHNGGEPGMVVGAALGGLIAALLSPTDNPNVFMPDLFVAGAMGGLLIGLAGQWVTRAAVGVGRWRERTRELGEIEKPTIPIALVLGGVQAGLEKQFLQYLSSLSLADGANVVQRLAADAEAQILAAADAAHAQAQMAPASMMQPPLLPVTGAMPGMPGVPAQPMPTGPMPQQPYGAPGSWGRRG